MEYIPLNPTMTFMAKNPRVEITAKALKVLKIEAALNEQSSRKALEALILRGASSQTMAIVEEMEEKQFHTEKLQIPQKPLIEASNKKPFMELKPNKPKVDKMEQKHQLAKNETAVNRIKELWTGSDMPIVAIAKEVGGSRSTVGSIIQRLIKKGELADRPEK